MGPEKFSGEMKKPLQRSSGTPIGLTAEFQADMIPQRRISTLMKMDAETKYDCREDDYIFLFMDEAPEFVRGL